jgi:ATP-dependent Zn protease
MCVCLSLFDVDYAFEVTGLDFDDSGTAERAAPNAKELEITEQLQQLSLSLAPAPHAASSTTSHLNTLGSDAGSASNSGLPLLALISTSTRIRIVSESRGANASNPSHTNVATPSTSLTYDNIGGLESEIASLRELVTLPLLEPHLFTSFGLKPPKGVLLYGPPGTGQCITAAGNGETSSHIVATLVSPILIVPCFVLVLSQVKL